MANSKNSPGFLKTTKSVTIPPNGRLIIKGQTHVKAVFACMTVCLDGSKTISLPKGVVISPSVNYLELGVWTSKLSAEVVNHSQQPVTISAKVRICDTIQH